MKAVTRQFFWWRCHERPPSTNGETLCAGALQQRQGASRQHATNVHRFIVIEALEAKANARFKEPLSSQLFAYRLGFRLQSVVFATLGGTDSTILAFDRRLQTVCRSDVPEC
jgi:hypothetical protein